jgi:hypothetical protein
MAVDTRQASGRRELSFASLDDVLADVEAVVSGPHRTLGNWTSAQILEHLARFIACSRTGFPFAAPWWLRLIGRAIRRQALVRPLKPGVRPPGRFAQAFMPGPDVTLAAAREHLREQIRLARVPGSMAQPSPVFGPLNHEQWVQMHCRHAEMHLSFIVPE